MAQNTYLITGATSGIGFAMTQQLAEAGHKIVAVGRNTDTLNDMATASPLVSALPFDVSEIKNIAAFVSNAFKQHPDINVVVNNAGIQENVRVDDPDYDTAAIEQEIAINLTAPVEISRACLPFLINKPMARIVNVTSGLAFIPKLTSAVYSATKSGLHLFSEGLRVQSGDEIGISEVILPMVATPMTEGRGTGKISADEAARQIIAGMNAGKDHIYVGKTKALPFLLKFAPFIARRVIQKN